MNSENGAVLNEQQLQERLGKLSPEARQVEQRKWTMFEIGEAISVKGIPFRVHDVSDQRLVLKFAK